MPKKVIQVGSGGWGGSWLQFIHESPDWELARLVSRGGPNLDQAKEQWKLNDEQCCSTLEEALDGPGDVVIVTVPHHLHLPLARQALDAGKSVLVEKPLSDDIDDALAFARETASAAPGAWVSQNFRFRKGLWQLHRSLAEGRIGKLLSIRLNFRRPGRTKPGAWSQDWRRKQWSFLLNELVIHHFDMCRFVSGSDAEDVFCSAWKQPWYESNGPESAVAAIRFQDDWTLSFDGHARTLCGPGTEFSGDWLVQTDLGCAVWTGDDVRWEAAEGDHAELASADGFPGFDRGGVLKELSDALDGKPTAVLPTVEDNVKSLATVFAAIQSSRENRVVQPSELMKQPHKSIAS